MMNILPVEPPIQVALVEICTARSALAAKSSHKTIFRLAIYLLLKDTLKMFLKRIQFSQITVIYGIFIHFLNFSEMC